MRNGEIQRQAQRLQDLLLQRATGGFPDDQEYQTLRGQLRAVPTLKHRLPEIVDANRSLDQFWGFIKGHVAGGYAERRQYIWSEFGPLLDWLDANPHPAAQGVSNALHEFSEGAVHDVWQKALERRAVDPEGAITSARTLLETVCKHILDDRGVEYPNDGDLAKLFKLTTAELNLAPDQHAEPVFKQILAGCRSVVDGLAATRNRFSDAHGMGKRAVKPAPRHADLAVNLSGAVATFLVATLDAHKAVQDSE